MEGCMEGRKGGKKEGRKDALNTFYLYGIRHNMVWDH